MTALDQNTSLTILILLFNNGSFLHWLYLLLIFFNNGSWLTLPVVFNLLLSFLLLYVVVEDLNVEIIRLFFHLDILVLLLGLVRVG